jgi:acetyl-CoA synthetase
VSENTSNTDISSILIEERQFPPSAEFINKARIKADDLAALHKKAADDYEGFWAELAREHIAWHKPFTKVFDESNAPHCTWFDDGEMNVSANCIDKHLADRADKNAIIFEGEQGDIQKITYQQLHDDVCQFANGLKAKGINSGDRIIIYMPMVPEAVIAMQACARIGAIHSVVFGGFSAESLRDRIEDAGAVMLITADGGHRGGGIVELKQAADKALQKGCATLKNVVVLKRTGHDIHMQEGRDHWWYDVIDGQDTN